MEATFSKLWKVKQMNEYSVDKENELNVDWNCSGKPEEAIQINVITQIKYIRSLNNFYANIMVFFLKGDRMES